MPERRFDFLNVKVPQATNPVLFRIRITIEATNRDQIGSPEGIEQHLFRSSRSVRIRTPLGDELVHEAEALSGGLGASFVDTEGWIEKRHDVGR